MKCVDKIRVAAFIIIWIKQKQSGRVTQDEFQQEKATQKNWMDTIHDYSVRYCGDGFWIDSKLLKPLHVCGPVWWIAKWSMGYAAVDCLVELGTSVSGITTVVKTRNLGFELRLRQLLV